MLIECTYITEKLTSIEKQAKKIVVIKYILCP